MQSSLPDSNDIPGLTHTGRFIYRACAKRLQTKSRPKRTRFSRDRLDALIKIGRIHVQKFADFVKDSYDLMINEFEKFVNIENSLHWSLSHVAELICKNDSYTLADYSEGWTEGQNIRNFSKNL